MGVLASHDSKHFSMTRQMKEHPHLMTVDSLQQFLVVVNFMFYKKAAGMQALFFALTKGKKKKDKPELNWTLKT